LDADARTAGGEGMKFTLKEVDFGYVIACMIAIGLFAFGVIDYRLFLVFVLAKLTLVVKFKDKE